MEFSKKLLIFSWSMTIVLTALSIYLSLKVLPMDAMYTCVPLAWAETATATGYYFWKSKNENRAKYAQKFLKSFATEYGSETAVRMAEIVLKD